MCPFKNPGQYLSCVLDSYAMRHVKATKEAQARKGETIKSALANRFELPIPAYFPINSGSMAKNTAINAKYDLDIIVPFPFDTFPNQQEMALQVAKFFDQEFEDPDLKRVRTNQSWSVGLKFEVRIGKTMEEILIDVVPGQETQRNRYPNDGMLWLKNSDEKKRIQTNVQAQVDFLKKEMQNHPGLAPVIRLLKVWKCHTSGIQLKSFMLELLTVKAFQQHQASEAPRGIWPQTQMVLEYIRDHIQTGRLIDPGNSNNHIHELLSPAQRKTVSHTVANILKKVERDPSRLPAYFPSHTQYVH